jgi:hypothetical protein
MRLSGAFLCACLVLSVAGWGDEQHHHQLTEKEIGSVHFTTSCSKEVAGDINGAVALLHSFQYEGVRNAFEEITRKDPSCAMAWWGIAMSHYHGLWDNGDMVAGRVAQRKAAEVALANSKTTGREKAYIEALGEIYREDSKDPYANSVAFEKKMGALQAAYPEDIEAAIFHALSLDITAPKTDKTFANQRKCGEILEPIFEKLPNHPGVAHYIIHCYDNPALAQQGLKAARAYAQIAPASAHANHMPSHIFTRVGSWEESVQSNKRSEALAAAAEPNSKNGEARDQRLHAMDYMEYAYLQSGRVADGESQFGTIGCASCHAHRVPLVIVQEQIRVDANRDTLCSVGQFVFDIDRGRVPYPGLLDEIDRRILVSGWIVALETADAPQRGFVEIAHRTILPHREFNVH